MMDRDLWMLAGGFCAGAGLGLLYFGALWLTVVRIGRVRRPGRLWLLSFAIRLTLLLPAFYILLLLGWKTLTAAVFGFLAARQIWIGVKGCEERRGGAAEEKQSL